jgi:hypothetical protein
MQNLITEGTPNKTIIKEGDFVRLDDDKWHDYDPYYVHDVEYRLNSTATKLILEDSNRQIFTTTVASHQIIKVA